MTAATTTAPTKRGRGRPPVPDHLRRTNHPLALSQVERDALRAAARAEGISINAYVRRACGLEHTAA